MKIQKFNESYNGDKIIKIVNNSIVNDFYIEKKNTNEKIEKLEEDIELLRKNILNLIIEYLDLNKEYFNKKYSNFLNWKKIQDFYYYIDEDDKTPKFSLSYKNSYDKDIWLKYKDIEDLINFINNPDFYRDAKKYNL